MKKIRTTKFIRSFCKVILSQAFLLMVLGYTAYSNDSTKSDSTHRGKNKTNKPLSIQEHLKIFYPVENDAGYSVIVCADLPDNNNPECVFKKKEPGHVFFILSKRDPLSGEEITRSFGFYPRVPVSCLFKQVRSQILDNSNREYNVSIEKKLSTAEFELLLEKCKELSKKKYNLNKYNCYDYVLEVFNSLPGIEKLPVTHVKFPFIFGRGGSPCSLYRDLKKLSSGGSSWAPFIRFGLFESPADQHKKLIASF